ncbi:hypothetical protein LCGC14_1035030 [marine sediment metagenome]|uniref:Sigma-54 factor interaction domain-containing protein n=1 Tax=marine sediment metagenome TaxID=412755 RepID=A0A0F9QBM4_9ZZZZ
MSGAGLPPLHERKGEIPKLARGFLRKAFPDDRKRISREAKAALTGYAWPGDLAELEKTIVTAGVISGRTIQLKHLPEDVVDAGREFNRPKSLQILRVIDRNCWVFWTELVNETGITSSTLRREVDKLIADGILQHTREGKGGKYRRVRQRRRAEATAEQAYHAMRHNGEI